MKKEYSFPHFSHYGLYAEVGKFFELKGGLWTSIKICPESNSYPLARHSMVHTQPSSTSSLDSQKPPNFFLFLPFPVYILVSRGTLLTGNQIWAPFCPRLLVVSHSQGRSSVLTEGFPRPPWSDPDFCLPWSAPSLLHSLLPPHGSPQRGAFHGVCTRPSLCLELFPQVCLPWSLPHF